MTKKHISLRLSISRFLCIDWNQRWRCLSGRGAAQNTSGGLERGCTTELAFAGVGFSEVGDRFVYSIRILENH